MGKRKGPGNSLGTLREPRTQGQTVLRVCHASAASAHPRSAEHVNRATSTGPGGAPIELGRRSPAAPRAIVDNAMREHPGHAETLRTLRRLPGHARRLPGHSREASRTLRDPPEAGGYGRMIQGTTLTRIRRAFAHDTPGGGCMFVPSNLFHRPMLGSFCIHNLWITMWKSFRHGRTTSRTRHCGARVPDRYRHHSRDEA